MERTTEHRLVPASANVEARCETTRRTTLGSECTVFVVDDDSAVHSFLRLLFESVNLNMEAYPSAESFLNQQSPERPGCLLLDVRLPGMSGLELLEHLKAIGIAIPVIMMTAYSDVSMAVRAMKGGAMDFLQKPVADQVLLESVHRAIDHDGEQRRRRAERTNIAVRMATLTPREGQVMDLVVRGSGNKQAAAKLGCSGKTVEMHRARVMRKMGADGLAELVRMAMTLESQ